MSARDRLQALTSAVEQRDAAAHVPVVAAAAAAGPAWKVAQVDLELDDALDFERWILDARAALGRDVAVNDALYAAVLALQDPTVSRKVRAIIADSPPRPTRRRTRKASST